MSMKLYFTRLDVEARVSVSVAGPFTAHRRPPTCTKEIIATDFIVSIRNAVRDDLTQSSRRFVDYALSPISATVKNGLSN